MQKIKKAVRPERKIPDEKQTEKGVKKLLALKILL